MILEVVRSRETSVYLKISSLISSCLQVPKPNLDGIRSDADPTPQRKQRAPSTGYNKRLSAHAHGTVGKKLLSDI
jgi:hypothetical protein